MRGLFVISLGLSANFPNDHDMLAHGLAIYDALFTGGGHGGRNTQLAGEGGKRRLRKRMEKDNEIGGM